MSNYCHIYIVYRLISERGQNLFFLVFFLCILRRFLYIFLIRWDYFSLYSFLVNNKGFLLFNPSHQFSRWDAYLHGNLLVASYDMQRSDLAFFSDAKQLPVGHRKSFICKHSISVSIRRFSCLLHSTPASFGHICTSFLTCSIAYQLTTSSVYPFIFSFQSGWPPPGP